VKHLKPFNESVKPTKRLSVEDIEDYFLEFIDNGYMEFYYSGIPISQNKVIETTFTISNKFRNVTTIEELTNFSNLINQIRDVVKRWNLDFKFYTVAIGNKPGGGGQMQTQLSIIQPVPKIIIDSFYTTDRVDLNGLVVSYASDISVDNNSDFILRVYVHIHNGGSGENGKWKKPDYTKFRESESEFIKNFTNGNIPCEFIEKKATADRRYGQPFYISWYFKLLV
jgi:hypothetical protein